LKDGGAAAAEEIENFGARLADLKVNKLGVANRKIVERLEKIWAKITRIASGAAVNEDDERFDSGMAGVDWAWSLLGVARGASKEAIKAAYHKLALKYHPDRNKGKQTEEKMKILNEAFELIRRIEDFK
jgi:preprotein translocase subunit Sec63